MNRLDTSKRVQIFSCLVEGMSIRSTSRICGVSKDTVAKFQVEMGEVCEVESNRILRNLLCPKIQIDELWAFVGSKMANTPIVDVPDGQGDAYTFTAICAETKLLIAFNCGPRTAKTAVEFIHNLAGRLDTLPKYLLTPFNAYPEIIRAVFPKGCVDYGQVIKQYGSTRGNELMASRKYSPPKVTGIVRREVFGQPDPAHISTSYVERHNLTIRMGCRRFTRLTNAFSKKLANHIAAQQMFFFHYNFCRVHTTIKQTPAMAVGKTGHIWEIAEVVSLLERSEPKAKRVWSHARTQAPQGPDSN